MTISYTANVAKSSGFGCFLPLLFRWRGSIYKLVWLDLITFLSLYYVLDLTHRFILNPEQKRMFESVAYYCSNNSLIPVSFVLGFYVSIVMGRWWAQYLSIPWPDSIAVYVSAHIQGLDDHGRMLRRTVMRYVCLCQTIVFTYVSQRVKKRFPTWDYLVDAGLLLESEKVIIDKLDVLFPNYPKHWLPIVWAASIVKRARNEGRIRDDFAVKTIIDELNRFRGISGMALAYDWISVPLVYTQVVTLAVYSYFIFNVIGCQFIETPDASGYNSAHHYFPFFATLEFFFYMGWLKVAESLINPLGEDDDDFEINWIVDRNIQISYLIVDEMHNDHPELVRDQYWDQVFPSEIKYANDIKREEHPGPSTFRVANQMTTSVDYGEARSTTILHKRQSQISTVSRLLRDRWLSVVSPKISAESIASTSSITSKQIGVVAPLKISKPQNLTGKIELADSVDDFEKLRRARELERIQRHANNLNRTVENLHNVVESSTIVQLVPTRPLVMTDSEASISNDLLSDDYQDRKKDQTQAQLKAKTKAKVTISEPIKSQDKIQHLRQTRKEQSLERHTSSTKENVQKLAELARKAKEGADKASTSKYAAQRSLPAEKRTDKATQSADTTTSSKLFQHRGVPIDVISDSDGSISFSDVHDDEMKDDNNASTKKKKLEQNRQRNDSEASTIYSDASDGPSDYEKPEHFRESSIMNEDVAEFESAKSDESEHRNWKPVETDVSTEYHDSQEELTRDESKDKTKPKTQDESKKKR